MNIQISILEAEQTLFDDMTEMVTNPRLYMAKQKELKKLRKQAKRGQRKWNS